MHFLNMVVAGPACKDNEEVIHAHCSKKCERTCEIPSPTCYCEEKSDWCACKDGFVRGADGDSLVETDPCVPRSPFCDDKPCKAGC
ncbi:hypothetical protein Ddc_15262 [Ditylenchus destructor]|nr:hypothetical protein Ddc_15262 [Ditylenchus destructor]